MGTSLIDLGPLAKVATVLIEKVSAAIGAVFEPSQIRRVAVAKAEAAVTLATAEAKAELIHAEAQVEISELQKRGLVRLVNEEGIRQENIESIIAQSVPLLTTDSKPEALDNDWIAHFFDRCRNISDVQMQQMWSRILAQEANQPQSFSKKTINVAAELEKWDAEEFRRICSFAWRFPRPVLLLGAFEESIYTENGVGFGVVSHLADLGLVDVVGSSISSYAIFLKEVTETSYFGRGLTIDPASTRGGEISVGKAFFTRAGAQLFRICDARPVAGFFEYVSEDWRKRGLVRTLASVPPSPPAQGSPM